MNQYEELNGKRNDEVRLRKPLPNERLSRSSMKERPPHILITNYAMLEYLMLRPEDNVFFDGEAADKWRYIVLDEAHTYTGSTGIEVSMLLRRLVAKLRRDNLRFILTSATLGDESLNDDILSFASNLCSANFFEDGIIRAKRIELKSSNIEYSLNSDFYNKIDSLISQGHQDSYIIEKLNDDYKFNIKTDSLEEFLYEVLVKDKTFWTIKNLLFKPLSVEQLINETGMNEKEISSFVEVASRASKNGSKLFDARYHMFLKATEGVFITLPPYKSLSLKRSNKVTFNNEDFKVFEAVVCKQCHALYLTGYINNNHLVQKTTSADGEIKEAFYVGNQISETDEDDSLESSEQVVQKYELCPHCGFVRSADLVKKTSCGHSEKDFVTIYKVKTTNESDGRVTKCVHCENVNRLGILRPFFSGQEASTSVIATSLFEELPGRDRKITAHHEENEDDGFDIEKEDSIEENIKAKQFIAFSDSRQAAAYFSSYLSTTYDTFLYGRIIMDVLKSNRLNEIDIRTFVDDLASKMRQNNIIPFDEYLYRLKTNSINKYDFNKIAWQALLKQFVDNPSRNSLFGLGLLSLSFNDSLKFGQHKKYSLSVDDVKNICMVFVMDMLADCAINYPLTLNDAEKEFFTHNGVEYSFLKDANGYLVRSFIPQKESLTNKRLDYLMKVLNREEGDVSKGDAKKLLEAFWSCFFAPNSNRPQIMFRDIRTGHYKVNSDNLILRKSTKWYRCSKCNKLTPFNVRDVCPSYHCDGKLEEVDPCVIEKNNHYYKMYQNMEIQPLRVVEHTAQLDREEAYEYQTLFKEQKIDVLSCSTTFEMGVDVGDLETVFMRNMPPSASNYAQRAGRAGRSKNAAAFALTFCNKSNHDFNYFEKPLSMIKGEVLPPHFKIDNEKICIRHLYSSAFSFFFKKYPSFFMDAKTFMEKESDYSLSGYDVFKDFLKGDSIEKEELKEYLLTSIPSSLHEKYMLDTFGWVDFLFDTYKEDYPNLSLVKDIYMDEIKQLQNAINNVENNTGKGISEKITLMKRLDNYREEKIINFLSRNNILPKYGFPVDTVRLETNIETKGLTGLDLNRDLSMAISEYAPGCQVIANGRLLTSRYIKKDPKIDWKKYDYIQCDSCKTLNVCLNTPLNDGDKHPLSECSQCKKPLDQKQIKTFIIPEFGFVAEEDVGKPSLIKPERTYRTEASFFNYDNMAKEDEYQIGPIPVKVSLVGNNGEMAITNTTDFYVCPECGYTIEKPKGESPFFKTYPAPKHKNQRGYPCNCKKFERYSLGYRFKTDVIRIRIGLPLLEDENLHEEAYSILQALFLGACKELDVDHTEIAGCLQYYSDGLFSNYSYILYDTTPGGAGHVKKLNSEEAIKHVFEYAYDIANSCHNCSKDSSCYSCLRTYENQRNHDIIKRGYVINYLEQTIPYIKG